MQGGANPSISEVNKGSGTYRVQWNSAGRWVLGGAPLALNYDDNDDDDDDDDDCSSC